jgi:hypothetical protein
VDDNNAVVTVKLSRRRALKCKGEGALVCVGGVDTAFSTVKQAESALVSAVQLALV